MNARNPGGLTSEPLICRLTLPHGTRNPAYEERLCREPLTLPRVPGLCRESPYFAPGKTTLRRVARLWPGSRDFPVSRLTLPQGRRLRRESPDFAVSRSTLPQGK